mgnify:CR=1 FL=1
MHNVFAATLCVQGAVSYGAEYIKVTGFESTNNLGLKSYFQSNISGTYGYFLASHLVLTMSYREYKSIETGYSLNTDGLAYTEYAIELEMIASGAGLQLYLFRSNFLGLYAALGGVEKEYKLTSTSGAAEPEVTTTKQPPVYSAHGGLDINLNPFFAFNISYSFSPGYIYEDPSIEEPTVVADKYISAGIMLFTP